MIRIDRREPKKLTEKLVGTLGGLGISFTIVELATGDFAWESPIGEIAIERKTVSDFLDSFQKGRLQEQLRRLIESYEVPILMIEGYVEERMGHVYLGKGKGTWANKWSYSGFRNILLEWQMAGVLLETTKSIPDTVRRIAGLYRFTRKENHESMSRRQLIKIGGEHPACTTIASLPGIGPKKAKELLNRFSLIDIFDIASEGEAELAKVLGKATARKVMEHLTWKNSTTST